MSCSEMIKEEIKELEELMKEKHKLIQEYKEEIDCLNMTLWYDFCLLDKLQHQLELEEEQKEEIKEGELK